MLEPQLISAWLDYARAGGAPDTTLRMRAHYVRRLSLAHDLRTLTAPELMHWLADHDWSPNTRKTVRAAIRAFYAWAVAAGHVESSPAAEVPPVAAPRGVAKPTPEAVYRTALATRDERVALMVRLAGQLGMRRAEVARCRREDFVREFAGWSVRVKGKGGHVRMIPVPDDLARAVARRPYGWLFPNRTGGHLSVDYVGRLMSSELPVGWSGHSLRHRCGTVAYHTTRDLLAVQQLLGHARPETTAGYIALPADAVRVAVMAAAA